MSWNVNLRSTHIQKMSMNKTEKERRYQSILVDHLDISTNKLFGLSKDYRLTIVCSLRQYQTTFQSILFGSLEENWIQIFIKRNLINIYITALFLIVAYILSISIRFNYNNIFKTLRRVHGQKVLWSTEGIVA